MNDAMPPLDEMLLSADQGQLPADNPHGAVESVNDERLDTLLVELYPDERAQVN